MFRKKRTSGRSQEKKIIKRKGKGTMSNRNDSNKHVPSSGQPKKSIVIRILVLIVAALMFLGAIIIPFWASGTFNY